jgi:hypothetical protein
MKTKTNVRAGSTGEGAGRAWYPPFNSGAPAYFTL